MLKGAMGVAAVLAALTPGLAAAQEAPHCLRQQRGEILGGLLGGAVGALAGAMIGQGGGRVGGAIIGGVGGTALGVVAAKESAHCGQNQYGYYDQSGRWVPNRATADGYEGPDGRWVNAPPPDALLASAAADSVGSPGSRDTRDREAGLETRIDRLIANGALRRVEGDRQLRRLGDIRNVDADYRGDGGQLTPAQRGDIEQRLDVLEAALPAGAAPAPSGAE